MLVDVCIRNRFKKRGGRDGALPPHLEVHEDVKEHEEQVRQNNITDPANPDFMQIKATDLCKTYPSAKRMAVCKNTFGARSGEVYGLLGPNGAGKSTTFSMMAMQIPVTSGNAYLMGHETNEIKLSQFGKFFGICN